LVIDDCAHQPEYHADILLNQNINAEQLTYVCDADSQLLLGTRYVLLRREFLAWHGWHRDVPQLGRKLLVTLGGGDPDNATLNVIRALQGVGVLGLETKIVVGPANAHFSMLRKAVEEADERIQLLTAAPEMPALMAWADAAVAAAGSTSWELALMGVPSLLLVLSENQLPIAEGLARIGVAINLGWHQQVAPAHITQAVAGLLTSAEVRGEMARRGPALVDGSGVDRTLMRLRGIRTRLRRACEEDARLLWEWANDSEVRAVSFSPDPIPWDQHLEWFRARLRSPDCIFFIAVDEGEVPIGQVRFDLNGDEAVISIGLDAKCRGKGYGSAIIERASRRLYQISSARLIHAYVKPDNRASLKVFAKAGFRSTQTKLIRGQPAIDMILSRD
jgi:spore coat polysaccharide biosynthesis predicted glycosyltransferase SpsG/RimJ/RimL family protein N-acetyltransferase